MRMSQAMASSHPPPSARPLTAAMAGFGKSSIASKARCIDESSAVCAVYRETSPMSAPAANALVPAPVKTRAPTVSSSTSPASTSRSSAISRSFSALCTAGRDSVTTPIWSLTSTVSVSRLMTPRRTPRSPPARAGSALPRITRRSSAGSARRRSHAHGRGTQARRPTAGRPGPGSRAPGRIGRRSPLAGHEVAQPELLDLAAGGARQLGHHLQALRPVLLGHALRREELLQLIERQLRAVVEDDAGTRPLLQAGVRHSDDRDPHDGGVLVQDVLHIGDRDVLSAADDHVLRPAGDVQVALGVDLREVAGVEPVAVEAGPGHLQSLGVAHEEERAAHLQPPLLPRGQVAAGEVDDADLHPRPRVAVALDELLLGVTGLAEGDQRVLALAPPAEHGEAGQLLLRRAQDGARYRRAHAGEDPQRGELPLPEVGPREGVGQERRGRRRVADPVLLDEGDEPGRVPDVL